MGWMFLCVLVCLCELRPSSAEEGGIIMLSRHYDGLLVASQHSAGCSEVAQCCCCRAQATLEVTQGVEAEAGLQGRPARAAKEKAPQTPSTNLLYKCQIHRPQNKLELLQTSESSRATVWWLSQKLASPGLSRSANWLLHSPLQQEQNSGKSSGDDDSVMMVYKQQGHTHTALWTWR